MTQRCWQMGGPGDGFISSMMPRRLDCKGGSTWIHIHTIVNMIGNTDVMFAIVWLSCVSSYTAWGGVTQATVSVTLRFCSCDNRCFILKGTVHPKSKIHIFPLTCRAIYQFRTLWCELSSFGDIGCRDFFLEPFLKYNGTEWCPKCVAHSPKKYIWKIQHQCLFP